MAGGSSTNPPGWAPFHFRLCGIATEKDTKAGYDDTKGSRPLWARGGRIKGEGRQMLALIPHRQKHKQTRNKHEGE